MPYIHVDLFKQKEELKGLVILGFVSVIKVSSTGETGIVQNLAQISP